jgi:hypothetical protein
MQPISAPDRNGTRWYWSPDLRRPVLLSASGDILHVGGLDNPPPTRATLRETQLNRGTSMLDNLFGPLLKSAIGSFIRALLVGLGGYLVSTGAWKPEDQSKYIEGITLAIVGLLWSLYQKYRAHETIKEALQTPAGTSLEKFNQIRKMK